MTQQSTRGARVVTVPDVVESRMRRPPTRRGGVVPRPRLLDALSAPAPAAFVIAPAGYGKTTTVAQWARSDPRPVAWLTLDERDDDPVALLASIGAAMAPIRDIGPAVRREMSARRRADCALAIGRLGPVLADPEPIVLVLDEAQYLQDTLCRRSLIQLIGGLPSSARVVVAGREWPSDTLAKLRSEGAVVEIGPQSLALSDAEALTVVHSVGVDLDRDEVRVLNKRTEGWAAGIYLAALAQRDRAPGANRPSFEGIGTDRFIAEYLSSEVLAGMRDDDVRFLEETAVLDRMSGSLCDRITGTSGSAARLAAFEQANLLVVPLDHEQLWFRYHSVFRDALLRRLEDRDPDRARELRMAASDWSLEQRLFEAAGAYAMRAEDEERLAALLSRAGQMMYASDRTTVLEVWIAWLAGRGAIDRHLAAAILASMYFALTGNPAESDRWADAAEAAPEEPAPDGSSSISSWLSLLSAIRCVHGPSEMRRDADDAVHSLASVSPLRPAAMTFLGLAELLLGDDDAADANWEDAVALGVEMAAPAAAAAAAERAALAIARGDWESAEEHSREAARINETFGIEEYATSALLAAIRARLAAHGGDATTARKEIARANRLRPDLTRALPHVAVQTRLQLASAQLAISDVPAARLLSREIADILRRRPNLGTLVDASDDLVAELGRLEGVAPGAPNLTTAELRLLPLLPTHLSFREIGEELHLSPNTVKTQAISIYRKLGVVSRSDAVAQASDIGLLSV